VAQQVAPTGKCAQPHQGHCRQVSRGYFGSGSPTTLGSRPGLLSAAGAAGIRAAAAEANGINVRRSVRRGEGSE
jgi:hypothetical protein